MKLGIVGATTKSFAWSNRAHLPGIKALKSAGVPISITTVLGSTQESSVAAQPVYEADRAATSYADLANDENVDTVLVSINVGIHTESSKIAADHGKTVITEWPLGKSLADTLDIAQHIESKGVQGYCMAQAPLNPEFRHAKKLFEEGFIGELFSVSITGISPIWGKAAMAAYLVDGSSGGNLLHIPVGHALQAIRSVVGDVDRVSAFGRVARTEKPFMFTEGTVQCSAFDQIFVHGVFMNNALLSIIFRGDDMTGVPGLVMELQGSTGSLKLEAPSCLAEMDAITLYHAPVGGSWTKLTAPQFLEEVGGFPVDASYDALTRFYFHLVNKEKLGDKAILITNQEAVKNYRVVDAIERSMKNEGELIKVQY